MSSASMAASKPSKPNFWDKVKEKIHIGGSETRTRKRENSLHEEARRTFAAPPDAHARRHSLDAPTGPVMRDSAVRASAPAFATSAMPTGVPLPTEQVRSVGVNAPPPGPDVPSLPAPLLAPAAPFKSLIERRTTGSPVLPASGGGLSIDSPAPVRPAERMPPPIGSMSAASAGGLVLPPASFTPAHRAYGLDGAAAASDAEVMTARGYSVSTALPVSTPRPFAHSTLPLSPSATYTNPVVAASSLSPLPLPLVPSQSTPVLASAARQPVVELAHYNVGGTTVRSSSPRVRLVPSPRSSPPPPPHPPPAPSSPPHSIKRDKYVWRQKMRAVNAQLARAVVAKRDALDTTAGERAVCVERAVDATREDASRQSVSVEAPDAARVSPRLSAGRAAAPAVAPSGFVAVAFTWAWFIVSYFVFGLQLLSVAAKETCEALATVFELISLGLSRVATDAHVRANVKPTQLAQTTQ